MVNAGADIWGNSRQKSTLTSGQMEIFVFTVPMVISIGVGHIDARELIKSTSTLLTVVHLQHVPEIPGKAHLLSCLSLSLGRMGLVQQLKGCFLLWEDCREPGVQPKGICGDGASKRLSHNPVWIEFL